jgi:hypothetical protein
MMFDKQYSSALLSISSPSKDMGKARSLNINAGTAQSSPHSTNSAVNGGSFKGI